MLLLFRNYFKELIPEFENMSINKNTNVQIYLLCLCEFALRF